ncbi:MAG: DUF1786 domain-containing protein [Candidatus Bathyarchaeota archaeon]|nr:MAG: DUF1786 domain-containing protein [Candidatus Bathyarchaeota archaeon]
MKVLAMDIGAGTVDILLYDDEKKSLENCIKLVLPSPSEVFAEKVREATCLNKDLCVKGDIIGGGAFAHALKEHIEVGFRVFMTEYSAYSVRNDLAEVEELGIKLVKDGLEGFKGETLMVREINIEELKGFLAVFGEDLSDVDYVAIAVQDHGVFPKGVSNRRSRIEKLNQLLVRNPKPEAFAFMEDEIPQHFLRMKSAAQASRRQLPSGRVLLMDTSPDAILGCLMDPIVEKMDPILAVNLGNGHTMSAIISSGEILAVMEHHTRLLNPQKIEKLLINFANGEISDEEVFNENGHGLFFLSEPPGYNNIKKVVVTGPNRNMLARTNLPVHFAAPAGDVMMTGPIGLVEAVKRKLERNSRA